MTKPVLENSITETVEDFKWQVQQLEPEDFGNLVRKADEVKNAFLEFDRLICIYMEKFFIPQTTEEIQSYVDKGLKVDECRIGPHIFDIKNGKVAYVSMPF